jgi:hypothetical protein
MHSVMLAPQRSHVDCNELHLLFTLLRRTHDQRVGPHNELRSACPVDETGYNICHEVTELSITAVLINERYFFGL